MKIVLIGAGSRCFGRGQIADVLQQKELSGRGGELYLVDVDAAALETIARVAERIRLKTPVASGPAAGPRRQQHHRSREIA
jgi:alpha-galactosidase/6-phospho-beta-glucosidase family protein